MKKLLICILVFLLCGCNNKSLKEKMDTALELIEKDTYVVPPTNNKALYSYYLQPSVGNRQSNEASNLFIYNNNEFVMNLNIANIINESYYQEQALDSHLNSENVIYERISSFKSNDEKIDYSIKVYKLGKKYLVYLNSEYFDCYGNVEYANIRSISKIMLETVKNARVNVDEVLHKYSSKEAISYVKESIQLFEVQIPENGRLDEMISDKNIIDTPDDGNINSSDEGDFKDDGKDDGDEGNFSEDGDY